MEETWIFLVLKREGIEWENHEEKQWTGICPLYFYLLLSSGDPFPKVST
jgi:hypothetical protein